LAPAQFNLKHWLASVCFSSSLLASTMADSVEVGMQVLAKFSHNGQFYPALVESMSKSKKRAKAPIYVKFIDSAVEGEEWMSLADLKLPAASEDPKPARGGPARAKARRAKAEAKRTAKAREPKPAGAGDSGLPVGSYIISESQDMREFSYRFDVTLTIGNGGNVIWEEQCGGQLWMSHASSRLTGTVSVDDEGKLVFELRGHWQCDGVAGSDRGEKELTFTATLGDGGLYVPAAPLVPPGGTVTSEFLKPRLLRRC